MPLVLVETPGAADANTYATLLEALAYNESRPHADSWIASGVTDGMRAAALVEAARLMDVAFQWTGAATSPDVQNLAWPRIGMKNQNGGAIADTVIPQRLKDAQAEFARQLLDADRTADLDQEKQKLTSLAVGSIHLGFESSSGSNLSTMAAKQRMQGDPTLQYLSGLIPDAVRQILVPSWYRRETVQRSIIFETTR